MAAAGGPGDAELDLDLSVGQAPGDEQEDLALAGREGLDITGPGTTGGAGRRRARHDETRRRGEGDRGEAQQGSRHVLRPDPAETRTG